jgi:hypothetical protein
MVGKVVRTTGVVLFVSIALPGCSMLTARGRQERAYERYVQKCSHQRDRLRAKMMKAPRIPSLAPSEPKETTELGDSPQSVSSGESQVSAEAQATAEASN